VDTAVIDKLRWAKPVLDLQTILTRHLATVSRDLVQSRGASDVEWLRNNVMAHMGQSIGTVLRCISL